MSDEKPLHVSVSEALGWTECVLGDDGHWRGSKDDGIMRVIPRFDTSWCATGVLLEKFEIDLSKTDRSRWTAISPLHNGRGFDSVEAKTPCEAICGLIVALHKEGKLNAA